MGLHHSAAIIIQDQKVLFIKRSTLEDSEPNKWCAPNETLKENESPESAVVRGVQEELGLRFVISKQLSNHSYLGHTTFVFLGTAEGEIVPNPDEVAEYAWFTYTDAMRLEFAYGYDKVIKNLHNLALLAD
ncbi:MAG: NUDIX hydrolase [Parcubacteria group bacterium GW2011_GWA2_43_11]|nr:MAG: NUDIX hydrolase [Parcubacteria group bacterium GW2011_GWC2_42_11]KKS85827.1 MAG: NUDIX hydrolase [Parcubacteria group bacterium GW2011_GWA2_43_11]